MTFYKTLNGLDAFNGGSGRYPGVGRWTRHLDPDLMEPCVYGFHLTEGVDLLRWLGPTIYEAEPCPDHPLVDGVGKVVTCRVRLTRKLTFDDRVARLFAADCAESALLGVRAAGCEPDVRSWRAVDVARRFASGDASHEDRSAARSAAESAGHAAWSAAWSAAGSAAESARSAAGHAAWHAAGHAVWSAAESVAWSAAGHAAWHAADSAARSALYDRLTDYLYGRDIRPVAPLGQEVTS